MSFGDFLCVHIYLKGKDFIKINGTSFIILENASFGIQPSLSLALEFSFFMVLIRKTWR